MTVNNAKAIAIIYTGSPVTVISERLFERMDRNFFDGISIVGCKLKKPSVKMYSCEDTNQIHTPGECDVKIENGNFQCIFNEVK